MVFSTNQIKWLDSLVTLVGPEFPQFWWIILKFDSLAHFFFDVRKMYARACICSELLFDDKNFKKKTIKAKPTNVLPLQASTYTPIPNPTRKKRKRLVGTSMPKAKPTKTNSQMQEKSRHNSRIKQKDEVSHSYLTIN